MLIPHTNLLSIPISSWRWSGLAISLRRHSYTREHSHWFGFTYRIDCIGLFSLIILMVRLMLDVPSTIELNLNWLLLNVYLHCSARLAPVDRDDVEWCLDHLPAPTLHNSRTRIEEALPVRPGRKVDRAAGRIAGTPCTSRGVKLYEVYAMSSSRANPGS